MNLVVHEGKLYAGLGNWMDVPYMKDKKSGAWTGAHIIVKESSESPWQLELELGQETLRVDAMKSVTFRTDRKGRALPSPTSLLVASSVDAHEKGLWVWVRSPEGTWEKVRLASSDDMQYCRSFGMHTDAVTGIDSIFAGSSFGDIYSGAFDPDVEGNILWNTSPELSPGEGRAMAFTEANNVLYVSVSNGLYMRRDGVDAEWILVYEWDVPVGTRFEEMRGLTTIQNPNGPGEVILGAREQPGFIERIDPHTNYAVSVELDVGRYFDETWGRSRGHLIAYNDMVPFVLSSGEVVHLISLQVHHPNRRYDLSHAFFLVRRQDGSYTHLAIEDTRVNPPSELRAVRAFVASPFNPHEFFVGGFDCNMREAHNTAWIFVGEITAFSGTIVPYQTFAIYL